MTDTPDLAALAREAKRLSSLPDSIPYAGVRRAIRQEEIYTALRDVDAKAFERGRATTYPMTLGVGDGSGTLFVHGDYESIKAAQRIGLERADLRSKIATLTQERDAMREELPVLWGQYDDEGRPLWISYRTRIAALEREIAELRAIVEEERGINSVYRGENAQLRHDNTLLKDSSGQWIDALSELRTVLFAEPSEAEVTAAAIAHLKRARADFPLTKLWDKLSEIQRKYAYIQEYEALKAAFNLRAQSTLTPYRGELNPSHFVGSICAKETGYEC